MRCRSAVRPGLRIPARLITPAHHYLNIFNNAKQRRRSGAATLLIRPTIPRPGVLRRETKYALAMCFFAVADVKRSYKVGGPIECVLRAPTLGESWGGSWAKTWSAIRGAPRGRQFPGITFCFKVYTPPTPRIKGNGNTVFASPLSTPQLPGAGDHPSAASAQLVQRFRSGYRR